MSRQASVVCVAERKVSNLMTALATGMRYPVVQMSAGEAVDRIREAPPAAVILADQDADPELAAGVIRQVAAQDGPYIPVLAHGLDAVNGTPPALPIPCDPVPARLVARLTSALRVRALHAAVQRRSGPDNGDAVPAAGTDHDPTVLVAGRGGGYPALSLAVGERVRLVGALSLETAERYLDGRDIDGIVIGDGFSTRIVETFLVALGADVRFRDLPVMIADSRIGPIDLSALPNADHVRGGTEPVLARLLPLVQVHAFAERLKRRMRALDTKGFVDAETGLLTCDAFLHDLARAVEDSAKRQGALSLARFAFPRIDRHAGIDAARIVSRLVRATDFACQDDDGAIHIAFGETDLKAAHVVARRIASVLKHTMLVPDPDAPRLDPDVSLVTRKSSDTAESLLARVHPAVAAAAQ
jgi:hypothetical protein